MRKNTLVVIGFLVLSIFVVDLYDCGTFAPSEAAAAGDVSKPASELSKVVAYYFHGTNRCTTCRKIEAYSHEAVETGFGQALTTGKLEWRALNVEEPANQHFIKDYKLYTRSLVLVSYQGEKQLRWKNLERVWELVGDKGQFTRYVQDEVKAFMEGR